jgi:hypothetical protein
MMEETQTSVKAGAEPAFDRARERLDTRSNFL